MNAPQDVGDLLWTLLVFGVSSAAWRGGRATLSRVRTHRRYSAVVAVGPPATGAPVAPAEPVDGESVTVMTVPLTVPKAVSAETSAAATTAMRALQRFLAWLDAIALLGYTLILVAGIPVVWVTSAAVLLTPGPWPERRRVCARIGAGYRGLLTAAWEPTKASQSTTSESVVEADQTAPEPSAPTRRRRWFWRWVL